MTELWPWLVLTGLGIFHGLNPAMGWHAVGWAWKLAMSDSEKLTEIQHTEVATGGLKRRWSRLLSTNSAISTP
jgi:hypothetical protein